MPKVANVVVTTDFSKLSQAAFPWAQRLANSLDAQLHVLTVVAEPALYPTLDMPTIPMPTVDEVVEAATAKLKALVRANLQGVEHSPKVEVRVGHDVEQIVGFVRELKDPVIVMATHGYGAVKHALLGSTAENVLRRAPCPVLSVRSVASD
jgi:nucleotide-binding universal stress UspA family protein